MLELKTTETTIFLSQDEDVLAAKLVLVRPVLKTTKRTIDVLISIFLLTVLSVTLLPIVSFLILIDSRGPVFYTQLRNGINGSTFTCYKFRTMRPGIERSGMDEEYRITQVGKYLRLLHIDELPQLLNVLSGQMSLVGPRPHMLSDTERFETLVPGYHKRHLVKPGITGLAQINGCFGWVNEISDLERRVHYDVEYIRTMSIWGDLRIVFWTMVLPIRKLF